MPLRRTICLCDGREVGVGFQIRGQVGEKARLHEIGHSDEVEGHQVGNLVRLNAGGELGDHLGVGDRGQLDLIGVGQILEVDQVRRGVGTAGSNPHGHRVGESVRRQRG